MLIVAALGGNALLRRGEPLTAESQRRNVRIAAEALAPVASEHQLVIGHGNGPQVGLLALQGAAYTKVETYPLDVLGAETEGMISYLIEKELGNLLPFERPLATLLTMVEVDPSDPAFENPSKFIGPVYTRADADRIAAQKGWSFKQDGEHWRRVVPSPGPLRIFELRPILVGIECVIDKDLASELLAPELGADLFVMLTDIDAVYADWGRPTQRAIRRTSPPALGRMQFAAGSMGPKVDAACRFASATGKRAAIGALADLGRIIVGEAGTTVSARESGIVYAG